jgi:glycosyltransferase involved in cell wall biosynthesis
MHAYFTVVIPTLNEENNLPRLLADLQNQSYKNFQIIVVDAKSKDKTQNIAKKYKVNLIISDKKNVSHQRNLGAKEAKTEWIVFMDADNRIPKNYLIGLKRHVMTLNPDILSTWFKPDTNVRQDKFTATLMNIFIDLNKNSPTPYVMESMILFRKKSFEKLGGFDTTIGWREGEELLKRAHKLGMKFEFVKNPRYKYSFRRFKKSGSPRLFQSMIKMEILRITKGKLPEDKAKKYYPMKGGKYYETKNKKPISSFEKGLDSWKSFFG